MNEFIKYISAPRFYISLFVIALAVVVWLGIKKTFKVVGASKDKNADYMPGGVLTAVRTALILVTVLAVLQINDINVTTLVASLGLVSAVVGIALQDFFKDIIMGIHIRMDGFFKVGDVVKFGKSECKVISFSARTVKLQDIVDSNIISVCNRNISEITVVSDVLDIDIPLSYEENTDKVYSVLQKICAETATVENVEKCEFLGTYAFESSSISYKIRIYCEPEYRLNVRLSAMQIIRNGLASENIVIPYQQIDIHQK